MKVSEYGNYETIEKCEVGNTVIVTRDKKEIVALIIGFTGSWTPNILYPKLAYRRGDDIVIESRSENIDGQFCGLDRNIETIGIGILSRLVELVGL